MAHELKIDEFAREIFFVDTPENYPDKVWDEFVCALSVILSEEDNFVLQCRYGYEESDFSKDEMRQLITGLVSKIRDLSIYDEMLNLLENLDNCQPRRLNLANDDKRPSADSFAQSIISSYGLEFAPFYLNGIRFEAMADGGPVYLWKYTETKLPIWLFARIIDAAADARYERLTLIANPHLTPRIEDEYQIEFNFLPIASDKLPKLQIDNESLLIS